ncbi:MAG: response regulator transcription factor [Bryobacteraceae bacterium]|nr:response regulator transcription factor [Bryobacteraceae bacterium]
MHNGMNDYTYSSLHLRRDSARPGPNGSPAEATSPHQISGVPEPQRFTVGVCETQPITVGGLRALLAASGSFELVWATDSLATGLQLVRSHTPDLLVVDKAFGLQTLIDALADVRAAGVGTGTVVWGMSVSEAEALRFLQAGARGILRKTADPQSILSCLATVASGSSWMQDYVFRDGLRQDREQRSDLTAREQQVLELVEQGMKNKEIAQHLGIRPGTVKIHLKHIFEKTGVRGRYGLALASMKDRVLEVARHQAALNALPEAGQVLQHGPEYPARLRVAAGHQTAGSGQGNRNVQGGGSERWF